MPTQQLRKTMYKSTTITLVLFFASLIQSQAFSPPSDEEINHRYEDDYNLTAKENWITTIQATDQGRTFGAIRRLKMIMPALMFKMGAISTILIFLTIFAMKGLAIGVMLLIFQFSNFFAKLHAWKPDHGDHQGHRPHDIHVHIHGDKGYHHYQYPEHDNHHYSPWDRLDHQRVDNYLLNRHQRVDGKPDLMSKLQELRELQDIYRQ